jgi:hypothetical protein
VFIRELEHAVRQRRREQQGLARGALGHAPQQEADVLDEAEVEHAVGFVQHAHLAGVQGDHLVLLDVVDQAAGRGDDHVGALLQQLALLVVVDAAVDQGELQAEVAAELDRILVDLDRQFAGRGQDQRARILRLAVGQRGAGQQAVDDRDQERQGLAGTGLGLAGDVAPVQGSGRVRAWIGVQRVKPAASRPASRLGCSSNESNVMSVRVCRSWISVFRSAREVALAWGRPASQTARAGLAGFGRT